MKEELVITFDSVNYTMQAEQRFEDNDLKLKIIPTPREISSSCGLSILTDLDLIDEVRALEEESMQVTAYWRYIEDEDGNKEAIMIEE